MDLVDHGLTASMERFSNSIAFEHGVPFAQQDGISLV